MPIYLQATAPLAERVLLPVEAGCREQGARAVEMSAPRCSRSRTITGFRPQPCCS